MYVCCLGPGLAYCMCSKLEIFVLQDAVFRRMTRLAFMNELSSRSIFTRLDVSSAMKHPYKILYRYMRKSFFEHENTILSVAKLLYHVSVRYIEEECIIKTLIPTTQGLAMI